MHEGGGEEKGEWARQVIQTKEDGCRCFRRGSARGEALERPLRQPPSNQSAEIHGMKKRPKSKHLAGEGLFRL
jgi:hypothetical protein